MKTSILALALPILASCAPTPASHHTRNIPTILIASQTFSSAGKKCIAWELDTLNDSVVMPVCRTRKEDPKNDYRAMVVRNARLADDLISRGDKCAEWVLHITSCEVTPECGKLVDAASS